MTTIKTIITQDETGEELVKFARSKARQLVKNRLTRSQIRNIFTEVRKIEALWESNAEQAARRLVMLKPKLEYQTARTRSVGELQAVLSEAIDHVVVHTSDPAERTRRFQRFMDLFEALLAYHRAEGGRN